MARACRFAIAAACCAWSLYHIERDVARCMSRACCFAIAAACRAGSLYHIEREVARCMSRACCFAIAAACCSGSIPGWCMFSEKYHVSHLSMLGHCFYVCAFEKMLHVLHFTQVYMSTW